MLQRKLAGIAVTSVRREIGSEHFLNRRFSSPETILARERVNRRRGAQTQRRERRSERGCGLFGLTTCAAVAPEQKRTLSRRLLRNVGREARCSHSLVETQRPWSLGASR